MAIKLFTKKAPVPVIEEVVDLPALRTWATNIAKRVQKLEDAGAVLSSPPVTVPRDPLTGRAALTRPPVPSQVPLREQVVYYGGIRRVVNVIGVKSGRYGGLLIEAYETYNDRDGSHPTRVFKCFKADLLISEV